MGKRKNKNQDRKKVALVFDETKRKDFLCGFRKRKLERKKKAQEELQSLMKEERKRIRQENKESYKKLVVSSRPIPDIEQLLKDEYEDEDVNVKIVELSSDTLQKKNLCIGENRPKEHKPSPQVAKKKKVEVKDITGMGSDEESEEAASEHENKDENEGGLKTKKEVKRILKRQATKKVQKSKVFQMKNKLERIKNKKKSHQKKNHSLPKTKSTPHPRKEKSKKVFGRKKH